MWSLCGCTTSLREEVTIWRKMWSISSFSTGAQCSFGKAFGAIYRLPSRHMLRNSSLCHVTQEPCHYYRLTSFYVQAQGWRLRSREDTVDNILFAVYWLWLSAACLAPSPLSQNPPSAQLTPPTAPWRPGLRLQFYPGFTDVSPCHPWLSPQPSEGSGSLVNS
jgi:hypothetical protein